MVRWTQVSIDIDININVKSLKLGGQRETDTNLNNKKWIKIKKYIYWLLTCLCKYLPSQIVLQSLELFTMRHNLDVNIILNDIFVLVKDTLSTNVKI